ncbi:hypothetical protein RRG08_033503 [Elysia crispata]|uniref:Uncharacterized protein n=1 Tax=Elysia crispata TaxID=231223 RepID=A0AAE1AU06_9GAST|nr:hypothetical protein RRG08_033503 [Elysia crispata]
MALRIFTRALQLLSAVALISVLDLIDSTQAYSIGSSSRPSTTMDFGKESSSVHSLSEAKWRAQQLGRRVHGEDKEAIGVSHEQKLVANLESDERKENSPMSLNSGSSSMSRSKRDTPDSSSCPLPANLTERVKELNSFLINITYLGELPQQGVEPSLELQFESCSAVRTLLKTENQRLNMSSMCTYIEQVLDNGLDAYPRYLIEAKCLCRKCNELNSNIHSCRKIRKDVRILRQNEEKKIDLTVGCFCDAA